VDDLDKVRQHFRLNTSALLGHSWGAVLALEYALRHPTRVSYLVIAGDRDFIPVEIAERIAKAIPNATMVTIKDCGHFAYLERAGDVRSALNAFFRRTKSKRE